MPSIPPSFIKSIESFFQYANPDNHSKILKTWVDHTQELRTHVIFQNCVSCNVQRFSDAELNSRVNQPPLGLDTYFCSVCFEKATKYAQQHDKGYYTKEYRSFLQHWYRHLYGNYKIIHSKL